MLTTLLQAVREWIENLLILLGEFENFTTYENAISIKHFGAKGDGVHDDSTAFLNAITSEYSVILLPKGTYNLKNKTIALTKNITLVGINNGMVEVTNGKFDCMQGGIIARNITFSGGRPHWMANEENYGSWSTNNNGKNTLFFTTPEVDGLSVEFYDCVFKDADFGCLAWHKANDNNKTLVKNVIKNCRFENLHRSAVLQMINIGEGIYDGNVFKNIGDSELTGNVRLTCLGVGDCSGTQGNRIDECTITNNYFDTLLSSSDLTKAPSNDTQGKSAVNFIQVQGIRVTVSNNKLKNLVGYAGDREGIYTKARYCEVANNYLENCGSGEGYICCKPTEVKYSDKTANVHDNILVGRYGSGITVYDSAKVHNNSIKIDRLRRAISCFGQGSKSSGGVTIGIGTVEVTNNQIASTIGNLYIGDTLVEVETINDIISVNNYSRYSLIKDNVIAISRADDSTKRIPCVIKATNTIADVTIEDNTIDVDSGTGTGIQVSDSSSATQHADDINGITINVNNNVISELRNECIKISMTNLDAEKDTSIVNNTLKGLNSGSNGCYVTGKANNNDSLIYKTQQISNLFANMHVITSVKNVKTNIPSEVTFANGYNDGIIVNLNDNTESILTSTMPNAEDNIGKFLYYTGKTGSGLMQGCMYESVVSSVTPTGTENPSTEKWLELVDSNYVLSTDTEIDQTKTYYKARWSRMSVTRSEYNSVNNAVNEVSTSVDNFKALVLASTDFADLKAQLQSLQ